MEPLDPELEFSRRAYVLENQMAALKAKARALQDEYRRWQSGEIPDGTVTRLEPVGLLYDFGEPPEIRLVRLVRLLRARGGTLDATLEGTAVTLKFSFNPGGWVTLKNLRLASGLADVSKNVIATREAFDVNMLLNIFGQVPQAVLTISDPDPEDRSSTANGTTTVR